MSFTPNTVVRLIRGVSLSPNYRDTYTFSSASSQANFFASKAKRSFMDFTYQRVDNAIRVPANAEDLWDCNYIMFQNSNYGDKWFYGFVTDVVYKNPETTFIYFQLDVVQTFLFDFELKQCFVEREHVADDTAGKHTVPEGLELGPYVITNQTSKTCGELILYILSTERFGGGSGWSEPSVIGGFPQPCYVLRAGPIDTAMLTAAVVVEMAAREGKADAIISMFTVPGNFDEPGESVGRRQFPLAARRLTRTPDNNKLYTWPYVGMTVSTGGQSLELKYELFDGAPYMDCYYGFGANMTVAGVVLDYSGSNGANWNYTLSMSDFPLCPWVSDYYQNWIAQNGTAWRIGMASTALNSLNSINSAGAGLVGSALGAGSGLSSGNPASAAGSVASLGAGVSNYVTSIGNTALNIKSALNQIDVQRMIPDQMHGAAGAAPVMSAAGKNGFYSYCHAIRPEYNKMIDDYFSMYGYKVNKVKVPNIHTRPRWNYIKTIGACIGGDLPGAITAKLAAIFDAGITFWHGDWIGDYSGYNGAGSGKPTDPQPDPTPDPTPDPGPVDPFPVPEGVEWTAPFVGWQSHVTSEFGTRINPITGQTEKHNGIDIAYPEGTPIMAIASGRVTRITSSAARGEYIDVNAYAEGEASEFTYRYQHLSGNDVLMNEFVAAGTTIAFVGSTGQVTGAHLHLEILKNGVPVNPRDYLPA